MKAIQFAVWAPVFVIGSLLHAKTEPLVIAPLVDGLDICQDAANDPSIGSGKEAEYYCFRRGQTSASRIKEAPSAPQPETPM
jgi:hypothetical protein